MFCKNNKSYGILAISILQIFLLSSCFSSKTNNSNTNTNTSNNNEVVQKLDTKWIYEKNIKTPISGKATSSSDLKLGNIETDKVEVILPKGATDKDENIKLENPNEVPNISGEDFKTLGAPIEVGAGSPMRLNEPATIKFAFDKSKMKQGSSTGTLRVVYFDGNSWSSIKPDSIDMDKGIVTFTSYHFSLLGVNQIDSKRKITEEWVHSKTLDDELKSNLNKMSDHVTNQIIDLTLEKMGLNDKEVKTKVLKDILKDDGYKKIYDSYAKGDPIELNQKIAVLAGKKISQIVPASKLQAGLKFVGGSTGDIKAVSQAAGYAVEGRYEDAAKIIGTQIIDKFMIGKAGTMAVEAINHQIGAWKDKEVEAAYNAFKDGANGKFWGYNVDKGDFDGVWNQMRGSRRQLEIEAVAKENAIRRESGMPPLTEAQAEMVKEGLKESFRRQFEERNKREDIFKKKEETLKKLLDGFDAAGFFGTTKPKGLDKGLDYENELDVLYHFAQKIMRDTKRGELTDLNGLTIKDKISVDDVVQGARYWFDGPDGPKKYAKFLKDRFNIILAPSLSDLAGSWTNGTLTVTDVIAPPSDGGGKGGKGGCDVDIDLSKMKGKVVPAGINITPSGKDSGSIKIDFKDGKVDPFPFTYTDGIIKGTFSKDGGTLTVSLQMSEDDKGFQANGPMNLAFPGGTIKILTNLKATKAKESKTPTEIKK